MADPITPEQLHESHRWIRLDELAALPGNPNQGDDASLSASLDEFGWIDGIVVHRGVVIAGNHRVDQARTQQLEGLPGYDLSAFDIDDARRMAMALAHNHTTRMGANHPELLADALTDLAAVDVDLAEVAGIHDLDADTRRLIDADTLGRIAPQFTPSGTPQPRLDQLQEVVCPNCGHEFERP